MTAIREGEVKFTTCGFCDGGCRLAARLVDGRLALAPADPAMPAICSKTRIVDEYRTHPDRLLHPLKNVGERGEPVWERVTWDEALDDIAARLICVIDEYGPEAVCFNETPGNIGQGGITRRLMNCIGTPNYTCPMQLCVGNTAQVHRAIYGWWAVGNWDVADCIVYFGQDRGPERWPAEHLKLKAALARGAKLIVVDPRLTDTAKLADFHLRIRYGTDAALVLGWLNVIIGEGLFDKAFVEERCIGFEELRERVALYPVDQMAEVCGVDAELICTTARLYATSRAALIPWGVVPDMQVNSTSLIQAQCIMRAICGFLGTSEIVFGPSTGAVTASQLEAAELLSHEQRRKQLGINEHPLLTFRASELYREANERIGVTWEPDIATQSCAAIPPDLWRAMRGEGDYLVRATFCAGNNTVMSYAGQQGIVEGFMKQDLVVVFDHWMTPTAQLADYVLPGDMWTERAALACLEVAPVFAASSQLQEPLGECRNWYDVVKGLADRLGFSEQFPWATACDLYDWQLAPLGLTFAELEAQAPVPAMNQLPGAGGFVTPSGKVELKSSVLEALKLDPLPNWFEPTDFGAFGDDYPYVAYAGTRDNKSYNTNLHQIASLRAIEPEPLLLINPVDAEAEGLVSGEWCRVESAYGAIELVVRADEAQPAGTVRIPHGWWKPEEPQGLSAGLSGAMRHNDGMVFPDEDWNLDPAQGVPNLRGGIRVRVRQ